jgi:hypothetical protein
MLSFCKSDSGDRLIVTTASGIVSLQDVLAHLENKTEAGVLDFAEIFDARNVSMDLSVADLYTIQAAVRRTMGTMKPGRVAVVTNNNFIASLARTYLAITKEENPNFSVFQQIDEAQAWMLEAVT